MFQTEDNCEEKAATRCRRDMTMNKCYRLGIDIGSTTVKIAVLDDENHFLFSDYERHFANIQETLADLLTKAVDKLGPIDIYPVITGSGGLTLAGLVSGACGNNLHMGILAAIVFPVLMLTSLFLAGKKQAA